MNLVNKCRKVVEAVSLERGTFALFALFAHHGSPDRWDLLFSAHWLRPGRAAIKIIVDSLTPELTADDWQSIVNIVPLDPSLPYVQWIARHYETEGEIQKITNVVLDGVFISHGYILAAKDTLELNPPVENKWSERPMPFPAQIAAEQVA